MKKDNKNIIQSYLFSRIRSRMSICEMRILMRLVEFAQCEIQGLVIADCIGPNESKLVGKCVEIPISSVLPPGSHHYEQVPAAAKSLMSKIVEHYEPETGSWKAATFVSAASAVSGKGMITLYVHPWVWDCILDFSRGFVKYDLAAAMSIVSPYALKLYFLMSNQKQPISYSFAELNRLFGTEGKYGRRNDFVRKVLIPAKRELDEKSPWSCDIRPMKDGRSLEYCMFFPYEQPSKYSEGVRERSEHARYPNIWAYHEIYQYMRYNLDFSPTELGRNKALINEFAEVVPHANAVLAEMNMRAHKRKEIPGKGWYINAIKSEVERANSLQYNKD